MLRLTFFVFMKNVNHLLNLLVKKIKPSKSPKNCCKAYLLKERYQLADNQNKKTQKSTTIQHKNQRIFFFLINLREFSIISKKKVYLCKHAIPITLCMWQLISNNNIYCYMQQYNLLHKHCLKAFKFRAVTIISSVIYETIQHICR